MKSIIAIALVLVCASALSIKGEDGLIKFDFENEEAPFGFAMSGHIDPSNELNNKISTFIKLAGHYIPILESLNNEGSSLEWARTFNINLGPLGTITIDGFFHLVVGWRVFVNNGGANMTTDHLDVTYAPFIIGNTGASTGFSTAPAIGFYHANLTYVTAYAPISLQIFSSGQVCFSGKGVLQPVNLISTASVQLKGCQAEILTDVIESLPITLGCGFSNALNFTHINENFTNSHTESILSHACISL